MSIEFWILGEEESIQLPFTETSWEMGLDANDNIVNLYQAGERLIKGTKGLRECSYSSFFPARRYDFARRSHEPYHYVETFQAWFDEDEPIRLILTSTDINMPVRIQSFNYKEEDGTGDVYYDVTFKECPPIEARPVAKAGEYEKAERRPRESTI